jgi:hypothetical protein
MTGASARRDNRAGSRHRLTRRLDDDGETWLPRLSFLSSGQRLSDEGKVRAIRFAEDGTKHEPVTASGGGSFDGLSSSDLPDYNPAFLAD